MQHRLYYAQPALLPNGAVTCEERLEIIDADGWAEAAERAKTFLAEGSLLVDERRYYRISLRFSAGELSAEARAVAERFFAHKQAHPKPEKLTPLQQRMLSGGA